MTSDMREIPSLPLTGFWSAWTLFKVRSRVAADVIRKSASVIFESNFLLRLRDRSNSDSSSFSLIS